PGEGLQLEDPEHRHRELIRDNAQRGSTGPAFAPLHICIAEGSLMSIKSDRWIREMAEKHGMIDPFVPGQIRENGTGRVISYGTSSYGYDVRCADDFKVFTNINSAI